VRAGETFGPAYLVGFFDDIPAMEQAYDRYKAATRLEVSPERFTLR
jgi:hypothetical protein